MSIDWSRLNEVIGPVLPNLWQTLAIVTGFFILLWVTLRYRVWFREDAAGAENTIDLLSDMKELHQEGGLTDEEFRSIKTRLVQAAAGAGALRTKVRSTPKPAAARMAEAAAPAAAESPQGRSEPPEAEARSDDAREQGPGRATS
jgi:hypothetical protein